MTPIEPLEARNLFAVGVVDTAFGVNGVTTAPTIGLSDTGFREILTQSDGKILYANGGGMARFAANGAIDSGFGAGGITTFSGFSFRDDAIDSSGRIYVLAVGGSGTFILRYTAAGALDSSFATGGTALVTASHAYRPVALDIQADGKLVVAGTVYSADDSDVTRVFRLTAAGNTDTGFGSGGARDFKLGASNLLTPQTEDTVVDLRVLSNGKIEVLGGSFAYQPEFTDPQAGFIPTTYGASQSALARLNSDGTLDSGFGSGGVARRAVFDANAVNPGAGAIRADGSAVVATTNTRFGQDDTAFASFTAAGGTSKPYYVPYMIGANNPRDAVALADGRIAFIADSSYKTNLYTFDGTQVGPVVSPAVLMTNLGVTADGDVVVRSNSGDGTVRLTKVDVGNLNDPRPDEFTGTPGAIDTVKDQFGNLHVTWFDTTSKTLKYVYRNAKGLWGRVTTVDATVGAGANVSIDASHVSNKLGIAIAYYDASTADLKVAVSGDLRHFGITSVATKGAVGISPSLQFTDAGYYAVSYYSKTAKSLTYAIFNGKAWTYELVDSGGAGEWNELVFDPDSRRPAIAYSGPANTVKYALKDKSGWGNTIVTKTAAGAAFVNLALPQNVQYYGPVISYYDLANADLVVARYNKYAPAGQRWGTTTVASRGIVGAYSELVVDFGNAPILYAWTRNTDSVSRYVFDSADNNYRTSTAVLGGGRNLSVATSSGEEDFAYLDTASGKLFVR